MDAVKLNRRQTQRELDAVSFYEAGLRHASLSVPDWVEAHKCFNIALALGLVKARNMRAEIARELSGPEVVTAQKKARDWLRKMAKETGGR